ncbi:MoaD/ThiS family protein [Leptospirillum ferrooxidans]|uniref:Uncharacterized protein n=1 Tax=Leptospirillum ferrooxidans (strain C2-3) TaxID=1162668 RepID=I0ILP3_LEPFC|nr:MoaD/ThiS family protein [Leptospirillum ferrooxidans]BAM06192.1 hypothetical protein LFE_0474 [Leptospirillum ferrooxidans C2-3]
MPDRGGNRFPSILNRSEESASVAPRTFFMVYFGPIREKAGRLEEEILTNARTPESLYEEIRKKYDLEYPFSLLRVAVNGTFTNPDDSLVHGDTVVFLPPFGGG